MPSLPHAPLLVAILAALLGHSLLAGCDSLRPHIAPETRRLIAAVADEDHEKIRAALAAGADPDAIDSEGDRLLLAAIFYGDEVAMLLLLEHGADSRVASQGQSALAAGLKAGDEFAIPLLDHAARLLPGEELEALEDAAWQAPEALKRLLATGLDPNPKHEDDPDPLWAACRSARLDSYRALIAAGARPRPTELFSAAFSSDTPHSAAFIDAMLAEFPDAPLHEDWLTDLVYTDSEEPKRDWIARVIAARGAPTQAQLDEAIPAAALIVDPVLLSFLLESGATTSNKRTLVALTGGLSSAEKERGEARAWADFEASLDLLVAAGVDLDGPGRDGRSAIVQASQWGHNALVKELLSRGADPDGGTTEEPRTALVEVIYSKADFLEEVMTGGQDPEPHVAQLPVIAAMLIEAGADPDRQDAEGFSALHHAAHRGDLELTRLLLEAGADPALRNAAGQTPAELVRASLPTQPDESDTAARGFLAVSGLGALIEQRHAKLLEILELLGEPLPSGGGGKPAKAAS